MDAGNPYENTEFWEHRDAIALLHRLRMADIADDLVWVLPEDVFAGAREVYGYPVIRADVPAPLIAHLTTPSDD